MKRIKGLIITAVLLSVLLIGCGGTPAGNNGTAVPEKNDLAANKPGTEQEQTPQAAVWPRTITDAAGHEVVLEKEPQRIAILHSMYLEYFFALGTPPTASAGANVGTAMDAIEAFATLEAYRGTADIIDLGSARELNLEAILAANPDVIVTFNGHGGVDQIYDELAKIAPVVLLDYTASWQDAIRDCAEIVGKEAVAEECIAETLEIVADAKEKLSQFKDKTAIFARSDGKGGIFVLGYSRYPYYYDDAEGFGLSKPEGYPEEWGVISLESLAVMDPDYIIFQDFRKDAEALVADHAQSPVWQNLKAVKNDQVLYLDVSLNTTSPLSLQVAARQLVEGM